MLFYQLFQHVSVKRFWFDFVHHPSTSTLPLSEPSSAVKFFKFSLVKSSNFPFFVIVLVCCCFILGDPGAVSQSGREKRRDESFQVRAKEPLGTDSHRTISKNSSGCRLLIGHKKCFVLLCPIGEQFLLSSFREFVHDSYCFNHGLCCSCTKEMHAARKLSL